MTPAVATEHGTSRGADKTATGPFQLEVPEAEQSIAAAPLREKVARIREKVTDELQGVRLATTQARARYWAPRRLRKCEARLKAPPAVHRRDRWTRHPFRPCWFET